MRRLCVLVIGLLFSVGIPTSARADWFATGLAGAAVGGRIADPPKIDYGGSFGWLGTGRFGAEVDASHVADFFQISDVPDVLFSTSRVTSVMFNGIFKIPIGAADARVQPYVSGGAGWMRLRLGEDQDFVRARNSHVGIDVGGGAHAMFSDRWGVGADLRYFRDLQDLEGDSEFFSLGEQKVDFWRVTAHLVIRF